MVCLAQSFQEISLFYEIYRRSPPAQFSLERELGLVNPAPAGHGALNRNVDQRHGIHFQRIAAQHDKVSKLSGGDAALAVFVERSVRAVDRAYAQRFLD